MNRNRKPLILGAGVIALIGFGIAMWLFQPWKAFTDETVNAEIPEVEAPADSDDDATGDKKDEGQKKSNEPVTLSSGEIESLEYESSGSIRVLELADGSRILRFDELDTSNGPDLFVWLTDQPSGSDDDGVYDDGEWINLGKLQGNKGSQNYEIPANVDLSEYKSAVIWCDRFNAGFASAPIDVKG